MKITLFDDGEFKKEFSNKKEFLEYLVNEEIPVRHFAIEIFRGWGVRGLNFLDFCDVWTKAMRLCSEVCEK